MLTEAQYAVISTVFFSLHNFDVKHRFGGFDLERLKGLRYFPGLRKVSIQTRAGEFDISVVRTELIAAIRQNVDEGVKIEFEVLTRPCE
jgi:hypothetical protein